MPNLWGQTSSAYISENRFRDSLLLQKSIGRGADTGKKLQFINRSYRRQKILSKNETIHNSSALSNEELANVSGGASPLTGVLCKKCGGNYRLIPEYPGKDLSNFPICQNCGRLAPRDNQDATTLKRKEK